MEVIKLLKQARTVGMRVTVGRDYSKMEKSIIIAVILHLISMGSIFVEEITSEGKGITELVIASKEEILINYKHGTLKMRNYENRNDEIMELFSKMQFTDEFEEYQSKWMIRSQSGFHSDSENEKKATEYLRFAHPVVNEDGHLLLTEDSNQNTVWAYVIRHKNSGTISYGVYKRDCNGRPSKTELISPSAICDMGTKLANLIKNYEGTFNSKNSLEASMKLWCWNLAKAYTVHSETDEYDSTDIYMALKEWIKDNAGRTFKYKDYSTEHVYVNVFSDHVDIGIWNDSLKVAFGELEIEENPKSWLREAVKEHWIKPQLKSDGSFARYATNTSSFHREAFKRKNKNERFFKFVFTEAETKSVLENYERNKAEFEESDLDLED